MIKTTGSLGSGVPEAESVKVSTTNPSEKPSRPTIHRRQFGGFPGFGGGDPARIEEVLGTNHKSDSEITLETDPVELFADAGSCVLSPEVTEGPLCKFLYE